MTTEHIKTVIVGSIAGLSGFGAWLFTLAPTYQTELLTPFINIAPVNWRPGLGAGLKLLSMVTGLYATYRAAKSGPTLPTK